MWVGAKGRTEIWWLEASGGVRAGQGRRGAAGVNGRPGGR